jgi:glycosyltransferase involved in cell wall biosynthesis
MHPASLRFLIGQLGARMHYAVPRIFEHAGLLVRFHTDLIAPPTGSLAAGALRLFSRRLALPRRILSRLPCGVPDSKLVAYPWFGMQYAARLRYCRKRAREKEAFLWAGREFTKRLVKAGFRDVNAVYLFNSAALEALECARNEGCFCVLEQTIAPMTIEQQLLAAERERWEGWEPNAEPSELAAIYADREKREWQFAHLVLCGSDFVAAGIRRTGGPYERCAVVPYGFAGVTLPVRKARQDASKLNVLFLGTVGLRKGIPYLYEAARRLPADRFRFRVAGPITLTPKVARQLTSRLELTGPLPRSEVHTLYQWADVFVLPSLCEGSATVCYEALAAGLPVITTPNAGSVVRDGMDGFIVPCQDALAIAEKLEALQRHPARLAEMSWQASLRSLEFTEEQYGQRLLAAIEHAWRSVSCAF